MKVKQVTQQYLTFLEADNKSQLTIQTYVRDLQLFEKHFEDTAIEEIKPSDLVGFFCSDTVLGGKSGKRRSANYQARIKCSIRAFFQWSCLTGIIDDDPSRLIKVRKRQTKSPTYLDSNEQDRLLSRIKMSQSRQSMRDFTIIKIALRTGLRLQELVNLNCGDVYTDTLQYVGKGRKVCNNPINHLRDDINDFFRWKERNGEPTDYNVPLFLSQKGNRISANAVERLVRLWSGKAGIKKNVSPHVLRHTFGFSLVKQNVHIRVIQELMNHEHISTTMIYTHVDMTEKVAAIQRI